MAKRTMVLPGVSCRDYYLIPLAVTSGLGSLTLDSKYAAFKVA